MQKNVIIGRKLNMTTRFNSQGLAVPVTLISAASNTIVGLRVDEKDGYNAVQVGIEVKKHPNKPLKGAYKSLKAVPQIIREFRLASSEDMPAIGENLTVSQFTSGDLLRVTGTTKGHGFTGVVKRWGFHGGPRTHGQSDRERAPGSIGQTTTPGRVFKGKKMAGHQGNARQTLAGIVVYDIDPENNIILVRGSVPGARNSLVLIEKVGSKKPLVEAKIVEPEVEEVVETPAEDIIPAEQSDTNEQENTAEVETTPENEQINSSEETKEEAPTETVDEAPVTSDESVEATEEAPAEAEVEPAAEATEPEGETK